MDKTEFINQLQMSLNGKLDPQDVNENVRYYEDYINTQIRMGRSEADVLNTLGSPRLIARTITDASGITAQDDEETVQSQDYRREGKRFSWASRILAKFFLLPKWAKNVIGLVIMVMVLSLIFTILKALLPIILVLMIVVLMAKFFRELK